MGTRRPAGPPHIDSGFTSRVQPNGSGAVRPLGREHDGCGHEAEAEIAGELEIPQRRARARRHVVVRRVSGASKHRYPPASPAAAD